MEDVLDENEEWNRSLPRNLFNHDTVADITVINHPIDDPGDDVMELFLVASAYENIIVEYLKNDTVLTWKDIWKLKFLSG